MKKVASVILIVCLLSIFYSDAFAIADTADCACIMNVATGEVVFSKNIEERRAMASTTKIMTAVIAIESGNMDDVVTVSAGAANQEGSSMYIEAGMEVYLRDLVYGLMLCSGNDAAVSIAEHISGSVEDFADLMNKKAKELGANDTHFVNPSGLYDDQHYTTAGDLAVIARYAMQIPEFRDVVSCTHYKAQPLNTKTALEFNNHNKLLKKYEGATGIKTGYTKKAGRCLVSSAMRDDMEFIAVTLNAPDDWKNHAEMLDYAFSHYYPKKVISKGSIIKVAKIGKKSYNLIADNDFVIPFRESGQMKVELIMHLASNLTPPINAYEKVGYVEVCVGGKEAGRVDILSEKDIYDMSGLRVSNSFWGTFIGTLRKILA